MIYVADTFKSYQGTGHLVGTPQYFVRFAGCGVAVCPIRRDCDEPDALTRKGAVAVDPQELVDGAMRAVGRGGWLHITGGEPTDQPEGLQDLARQARAAGLYVHLQTSGIRRVPIQWDWLTVSPKGELLQTFGQEMVVIDDGTVTVAYLHDIERESRFWTYYLCPLWGREMTKTKALAEAAGRTWNLTMQMHKIGGFK